MAAAQSIKNSLFELTVKMAPDRLKLFVDAKPASPPVPVTRKDLINALSGVTRETLLEVGVLDDIAERLSKGEPCLERRVAKGTAAVPGNNGRLALMVKPFTGRGAPRANAQGIVDFHSVHLFDNLEAGAVIAKIFPPTGGQEGVDASGKALPAAAGKPVKVSIDKTIRLERPAGETLECLVASNPGYLFDDGGRFGVREELTLPSDVDMRTGSVEFIGKLIVSGDVAPGFFAKGRRGVQVNGGIRDAIVESSAGDVTIKGFAFGGAGSARVLSAGSMVIQSAQELLVEARGDLIVEKHATDCILRTHRSLQGENAKIVGGHVFAVCGGQIAELGNEAGLHTIFQLCSDVEADPAYATLEARIANHTKAIGMIENHLGPYAKTPARIQLLKAPFRQKMEDLSRKLVTLQKSLLELERGKAKLLAAATTNDVLRVNITKMAYSGVEILCRGESIILKDDTKGPISIDFDPATKKFAIGALQPLTCNVPDNHLPGAKDERKK